MAGNHGPPNRTAPLTEYGSVENGNLMLLQRQQQQQQAFMGSGAMKSGNVNRPMVGNNPNSSGAGFGITNVPSNENLDYLLNGNGTMGSQSHELDLMDTSRNLDGGIQLKREPASPRLNFNNVSRRRTKGIDRRILRVRLLVAEQRDDQEGRRQR